MYTRLIKFVDKNKILSKHQYGFRKNRSTEHAVIELDRTTKAIVRGNILWVFFLTYQRRLTLLITGF